MKNGFCNITIKEKKYTKSSRSSLSNLGKHLLRIDNQDNKLIDKSKTQTNEILISMSEETINKSLDSFLKSNELKTVRKDQIQAYQVIFSCDKKTFDNQKLLEEWKKETLSFMNTNPIFKDNVLLAVFHKDETQPHIQAVVVPKLGKKLAFNELLGGLNGSEKLKKLHEDYAKHYTKLGFKKGDGTHTNNINYKKYMKAVSDFLKPVEIPEIKKSFNPYKTIENLEEVITKLSKQVRKTTYLETKLNSMRNPFFKLKDFYLKNKEVIKDLPELRKIQKQSIEKNKAELNKKWREEAEMLESEKLKSFLPAEQKIKVIEEEIKQEEIKNKRFKPK